jgi:hypothetical protein
VKFRRNKAADQAVEPAEPDVEPETDRHPPATSTPTSRAGGPWDVSEIVIDEDDDSRIDLGGLLLPAAADLEIQMQVDEGTEEVIAVLLAGPDGAAELRAFAAPRHGDIWDDARRSIAAEVAQHGGTATEAEGPFGTELHVVMTVELPDGSSGQQPSRVLGIRGPRWLLRVTLFGRPAVQPDEDGDVERALRDVVVVRGNQPMPPGDPLPLTIPAGAQRTEPG